MKKQGMVLIISIGLLSHAMTWAIMNPKQLWDCATTDKCSKKDRDTARAWLIGGSVTAIAVALTAFGIIKGPEIVQQAKREAIDKEIADIRIRKGSADAEGMSSAEYAGLVAKENALRQKRSEFVK